jgi:hypothetical protein
MLLLVPRDPLAPRRADPHFADAAVRGVPADGAAVSRSRVLRSQRHAAMDTPSEPPSGVDVVPVADAVAGLGLPSVTVDLARRDHGDRRVAELGDGRVGDRPRTTAADLLGALVGA